MSRMSTQQDRKNSAPVLTTFEYEVPDGGYGWVVVFCAFIFIAVPIGLNGSFAIYYEEWIEYFNAGKVKTSLIGSVFSGCIPLLGSLGAMALTMLFDDIRLVGIVGCIISSIGFVLSYFVYDVSLLAFTYGAVGGLGMGLTFNCAFLSVGYYFDKNRPFATAIASSGSGLGTLISRVIRLVISTYGWRGSMLIIAAICIQCVVFAALIRPLHVKRKKDSSVVEVEELMQEVDVVEKKTPTESSSINKFSSHEGVFHVRRLSGVSEFKVLFSSHELIRCSKDVAAMTHRIGDVKLNPYHKEDIFFSGSTFDIESIQENRAAKSAENFTSPTTTEIIPVYLTGWAKVKSNLRKNFNLRAFRSLTFCLIVFAVTFHYMAYFVPHTYIISLAREKNISTAQSEYLIICFGMSNFISKLLIGKIMTVFDVEQLYVVMATLTIAAIASTLLTFCEEYYQFVIVSILYGGTSPIMSIYLTNILVCYLGIENLTNAFSIVTIIRGFGNLSGPPLAGYLIELTNITRSAFYVGSCADICSAAMFGLVLFVNRQNTSNQILCSIPCWRRKRATAQDVDKD